MARLHNNGSPNMGSKRFDTERSEVENLVYTYQSGTTVVVVVVVAVAIPLGKGPPSKKENHPGNQEKQQGLTDG